MRMKYSSMSAICLSLIVACEAPPIELSNMADGSLERAAFAEWRPIPTARGPGQWISEWRIVEPTQFIRICAVSSGELSLGLSDITEAPQKIIVMAVQVDEILACIYPEDGALDDISFQQQRAYRVLITAIEQPTLYIEFFVTGTKSPPQSS